MPPSGKLSENEIILGSFSSTLKYYYYEEGDFEGKGDELYGMHRKGKEGDRKGGGKGG